jgi:hypothetical protein
MLTRAQVAAAAAVRFISGSDVLAYFETRFGAHFVDWFNAHCANRAAWEGKALDSSGEVKARFAAIWNNIPLIFDTASASLLQFAALQTILTGETGAELQPCSELCGCNGYPGLVYAFEHVQGMKASYNSEPGNKLAGDLFFKDADFWAAHGHLPAADLVRSRPDLQPAWDQIVYPKEFPTSLDPSKTGFIQQADFFKFRGRGFLQTTWRANYKPLVEYVQTYAGANSLLAEFRERWAGQEADTICTISTNEDWDRIFAEPELILACRAIALHNEASGNYLNLSADFTILSTQSPAPGSLYRMGLRVNGGAGYAGQFRQRALQMLEAIDPQP